MKKSIKNGMLGIIILLTVIISMLFSLGCVTSSSTSSTTKNENYSYPLIGSTNFINIPTKDFEPVQVIFVNSEEIVDSLGNHTGSKLTYEMFMREAVRVGAHNVININIDVKLVKTRRIIQSRTVDINTYIYAGTGLAIRYTNAINNGNLNREYDISNTMNIQIPRNPDNQLFNTQSNRQSSNSYAPR